MGGEQMNTMMRGFRRGYVMARPPLTKPFCTKPIVARPLRSFQLQTPSKINRPDTLLALKYTSGSILFATDLWAPQWSTQNFGEHQCSKYGTLCYGAGSALMLAKQVFLF